MRLKYRFVLREVSGQWVAVAVGKDHAKFNGMVKLNSTGAFLMTLLTEGEKTKEELLTAMLERYEVTEERASANLDSFLQTLEQGDLLAE